MGTRTAWPGYSDVVTYLNVLGVTIPTAVSTAFVSRMVDAVVADLQQRTRRQFLPDQTDVTRTYDGNGTGEMEIDDYISISSINILGWYGQGSGLTLTNFRTLDRYNYPKSRVAIRQGSLPVFGNVYLDHFPVGRDNIQIVGKFGYSEYIPDNVWEAVAGEVAVILATHIQYDPVGFQTQWREADVGEMLVQQKPKEFLMEHAKYKAVIAMYKPSVAKRIRLTSKRVK